jgi:hypothetical protein
MEHDFAATVQACFAFPSGYRFGYNWTEKNRSKSMILFMLFQDFRDEIDASTRNEGTSDED